MLSPALRGLGLALLSSVLACGTAAADPKGKDKKDTDKDPPGKSKVDPDRQDNRKGRARWEWTLSDGKGKEIDKGTFQGDVTGRVFHGEKQIGTHKRTGDSQVHVHFTDGKLKGKAELRMTQKRPATFEGELVRDNGKKVTMVLVILDD